MIFCFYELNLLKILCLMLLLRLHLKETHNVSFRINTDNQRANWSRLTGHTHTHTHPLTLYTIKQVGFTLQQCCCCCRADWTGGVGKQHNTEAVGGITCTLVMRLIRTYILGLSANKIIFINCQKNMMRSEDDATKTSGPEKCEHTKCQKLQFLQWPLEACFKSPSTKP